MSSNVFRLSLSPQKKKLKDSKIRRGTRFNGCRDIYDCNLSYFTAERKTQYYYERRKSRHSDNLKNRLKEFSKKMPRMMMGMNGMGPEIINSRILLVRVLFYQYFLFAERI